MKNIIWSIPAIVLAAGILLSACEEESLQPDDDTVTIGTQEWMASSLDVDTFRNGDPIHEVTSNEEWNLAGLEGTPAWCYYDNDPHNGELYGRMYNYHAIVDPRGLAPEGWHVSTGSEWDTLIEFLGGTSLAAQKLKSEHLWADDGGGNNSSGFTALPGSYRHPGGNFLTGFQYGTGHAVAFWSSSGRYFIIKSTVLGYWADIEHEGGLGAYVRCVKGATDFTTSIGNQSWAVQNLDVDTFRNGEEIPYASNAAEWTAAAVQQQPAWCYYLNDPANGNKYGRLYNWYAVADSRGLAPTGWKIPDVADWTALGNFLVANGWDGGALKSVGGWASPHAAASNATGFSALPGEMRFDNGAFYEGAELALFWSSHQINEEKAEARGLHGEVNNFSVFLHQKGAGLSVRCLRE